MATVVTDRSTVTRDVQVGDEFELDVRITDRPKTGFIIVPKGDGWTTYTTCHATCTCPPDSGFGTYGSQCC